MEPTKPKPWLFGQFTGRYTTENGQVRIADGTLNFAQATESPPTLTGGEELFHPGETLAYVNVENNSWFRRRRKMYLNNVILRQYTLTPFNPKDPSQGYIKSLAWAQATHSWGFNWWWLLPLLGLGLGLSFCQPPSSPSNSAPDTNPIGTEPEQLGDTPEPKNSSLSICEAPIRIDADLLFDSNKDTLKPEAFDALSAMAPQFEVIRNHAYRVRFIGHTDAFGDDQYNQALSERRADRIASWFIAQGHISPRQVSVEGRGETQLLVSADRSSSEQAPNRRVEIKIECSLEGVPITLDGDEPIFISRLAPEAIEIDEAIVKPELFLRSCGRPISLDADVLFDFNQANLKLEALVQLQRLADIFSKAEDPNLKLKVVGHTDTYGSSEHNLLLSEKRALQVALWLIENTSLEQEQLVIEGLGEQFPLTDIDAPVYEQHINRRVELWMMCQSKPIGQSRPLDQGKPIGETR